MRHFFLSVLVLLLMCAGVRAQHGGMPGMHMPQASEKSEAPFHILGSQSRTLSEHDLNSIDTSLSRALAGKNALVVSGDHLLLVRSGPPEDMLSYRIGGIRNPTLLVQRGSTVHILFVNVDDDMNHDLRFGTTPQSGTANSVGTHRLAPVREEKYSAEELTVMPMESGKFSYYCSVSGHAAGGMKGTIIIGDTIALLESLRGGTMKIDTSKGAMPGMNEQDTSGMSGMHMDHNQMQNMNTMQMGSMQIGSMEGMDMGHHMEMSGMLRTEPMSQEGSGTSWQPASSPMYMWMTMQNDWMLMLHGAIMPRYDHQGGPRGGNKFDAPNWVMGMAEHAVGDNGQFAAHLMMSLDPVTEGGKGYPLLLQTGETWQNVKLVDFQHPHDLFAEVSVTYSEQMAERSSIFAYVGYPGEPALGPPVFMHRPSAMSNPNAPLTHHWMDATHITFGVATAGITFGDWKLEGSYFNGKEPDENRYDFDPLQLNSYSGRLSFNPSNDLALQLSSGFIKNPESDGIDVVRTTASAIYTTKLENKNWCATTVAWGQNHEVDGQTLQSFLLESQYDWKCWTGYGRAEYVQKTNSELNILDDPEKINGVEEITIGLTRKLFDAISLDVDLGAQGTYNIVPPSLESLYSAHPISWEIYLSFHPSRME